MQTATAAAASFTDHARRQCESRSFPVEAVATILAGKLAGWKAEDIATKHVAVYICETRDRGSLIGSNGSQVWAIVRAGRVATVMLRRPEQPATKAALDVDVVIR